MNSIYSFIEDEVEVILGCCVGDEEVVLGDEG